MSVSIRLLGFVWIAVMALACSSRGNGNAPAPGSDMSFTVNPDGSVTYHNWDCEPTQMYTCKGPADCAGAGICQADRHTLSVCMCPAAMPDTGTPPLMDSSTPPPPDAGAPDTSTPPPPVPGKDQCLSVQDRGAIGDVDAAGSVCRVTCLATGGANCYSDCVKQFVGGISDGCLDCFADKEACITPCALSCLGDDVACTNCKCGRGGLSTKNCLAELDTCTGVPTNACN